MRIIVVDVDVEKDRYILPVYIHAMYTTDASERARIADQLTDRLFLDDLPLCLLDPGDAFFEHCLTTSLVNLDL